MSKCWSRPGPYNLGPQKLMRRIVFEDGAVVDIETLGYGYREKS